MGSFSTRRVRAVGVVCVLATIGWTGTAESQQQFWQPPLGIPVPSFGIGQAARAVPSPWIVPTAGFYYVDATVAGATDTSNPYGTPAKPRSTIPTSLPAGSVVELHGTYAFNHTSPRGILSLGTPSAPVFIRGVSRTARPHVTGCWEVWGSYFVIENIEVSSCGSVVFHGRTHHAALRHSDVHGNPSGGGVGVVSWDGDPVNDVVLWNNVIHDNGDVNASYDQDVHGIAVGAHVSNLWILDNEIARNSGDGIQINAGSAALQAGTHHIYVGRNTSHHNKQNGFWTKQAVDVIFSQNKSYGHRPGNSSLGACMGGQYAPEFVWFIANAMWDCDYGIQLASDNGLGTGTHQFFIDNIIFGIHDSQGTFEPGSGWQNCAISLPGGTFRYIMENSIYNVDSGVCVPHAGGALYIYDNLVQSVRPDGHHLMIESLSLVEDTLAGSNLFAPDARIGVGGVNNVYRTPETVVKGANNLVLDVGWVDPAAMNFRLKADSPARNIGMMSTLGIWQYFQARYGTSIARDASGVPRDTSPDAGAVEYR